MVKKSIVLELALLLLLASLWGASYTLIKIGVATIPPITLIHRGANSDCWRNSLCHFAPAWLEAAKR